MHISEGSSSSTIWRRLKTLRENPPIFQVRFFRKNLLLYFASDDVSDMSEQTSLTRGKEAEEELNIFLEVDHRRCL